MRPRLTNKETELLEHFVNGLAFKPERELTTEEIDKILDVLLREDVSFLLQKIQGKSKRGPRIGSRYKKRNRGRPPSPRKKLHDWLRERMAKKRA